ncbi:hypothetical protein [Rathayibacter sp. VKM Ac-2630]|uniref:hypothetical protein n=1 Tax=Rathayibacter sp. VKM Ac-2630 TaxID=1938617 RepID=UPI000980F176|nr:hypothetical protein [Rathayibacter sp. VKM Ac-2630]OOB92281.1 hypothetical protein B0T42_01295 [Rathayibacter sp. VKM Ac-2630]
MRNRPDARELRRLQKQHRALLHRRSPEVDDSEWALVRDAILAVLTDEDLWGLFPESSADEYLPEAVDLTRLLLQDGACLGLHVRTCWAAMFDTVLETEVAERLAGRITAEVLEAIALSAGSSPDASARPAPSSSSAAALPATSSQRPSTRSPAESWERGCSRSPPSIPTRRPGRSSTP